MNNMNKKPYWRWLRLFYILQPFIGLISISLSFLVIPVINMFLKRLSGYKGRLKKLRIGFRQPSIVIEGFSMEKLTGNESSLFFSLQSLEIKLDRKSLWAGKLKCTIKADEPAVVLTKDMYSSGGKGPGGAAVSPDVSLSGCNITNGRIEYVDMHSNPVVRQILTNITFTGSTRYTGSDKLPLEGILSAQVSGGEIALNLKTDISAENPAFDLNASIQNVDMRQLNNLFEAYAGFNVKEGVLELFTEVACAENQFKGYVKPFIQNHEVLGAKDKNDTFPRLVWETLLATVGEIFRNHKEDELSTKIYFSGTFQNPKVNIWFAVAETLRNAFVHALKASIDNEIDINSVGGKKAA
jgi:hypothetical protein